MRDSVKGNLRITAFQSINKLDVAAVSTRCCIKSEQ